MKFKSPEEFKAEIEAEVEKTAERILNKLDHEIRRAFTRGDYREVFSVPLSNEHPEVKKLVEKILKESGWKVQKNPEQQLQIHWSQFTEPVKPPEVKK